MNITKSDMYVNCKQTDDEDLWYLQEKESQIKSNRVDLSIFFQDGQDEQDQYEWDDFDYESDEFDEGISSQKFDEVDVDKDVPQEDRAFQMAMEIGEKYGWEFEEIKLLANVFSDHGWSFTKRSIIKELEFGMTFNEFKFAVEIRKIWQSHTEFSICYSPFGSFGDKSLKYKSVYINPDWSFCLKIIRGFYSFLDSEELEQHFISLYTIWRFSSELRDQHISYHGFIRDIVNVGDAPLDMLVWKYSHYEDIGADCLNCW